MKSKQNHAYELIVYNERIKIYIDGIVFLSFNQLDFKGYYAFKDDTSLYGIDFYLISSDSGGKCIVETSYKTKIVWLEILKLLDNEL